MVLVDILSNEQYVWTPNGIQCPNVETAKEVRNFLREAVLDRHIYLSKVIGFSIHYPNTKQEVEAQNHRGVYIARHQTIGESYPELMVNLLDKVFLDPDQTSLKTYLDTGVNTLLDHQFGDLRGDTVDCLFTDPTIARCLDKSVIFEVRTLYGCGYRSMSENAKIIKDHSFFPCYTDFSLQDYVRVLPIIQGTTVQLRYYNGLTVSKFRSILSDWYYHYYNKDIKEVELRWMQNFERYAPMI